jgi:hypothetical protein
LQFLCEHIDLASGLGIGLQPWLLCREVVVGPGLLESRPTVLADHHKSRQKDRVQRTGREQRADGERCTAWGYVAGHTFGVLRIHGYVVSDLCERINLCRLEVGGASHAHSANTRELIAVASASDVYVGSDGVRGDTGGGVVLSATTATLQKS